MQAPFPQILGRNQVDNVEIEPPKNLVSGFQREPARSFEYVVKMRLGNPDLPREPALRRNAATHAKSQIFD
jgi:hypothetical protein